MIDITLRPLRAGRDRAALASLFADPDTRRWNPGPETDLDEWCKRNNEVAPDFGTWAAADPSDGRLLGVVSGSR